MEMYTCPVCLRHEFERPGDYEICPECGWENDKVQAKDHDFEGGANELSVKQLRAAYVRKKNIAVINGAKIRFMEEKK